MIIVIVIIFPLCLGLRLSVWGFRCRVGWRLALGEVRSGFMFQGLYGVRYPANVAHIRQSGPDSGFEGQILAVSFGQKDF